MRFGLIGIALLAVAPQIAFTFPAKFGLSPDNSQELLLSTIKSAKRSILLNAYQFDSRVIADSLIERVKTGVSVQILVEGKKGGGLSEEAKKALTRIQASMRKYPKGSHAVLVKNATSRFVFNHAKYAVLDNERVFVSSDNFKSSGFPDPGNSGNRGWHVVVSNPKLARELTQVFKTDSDLSFGDVVPLDEFIGVQNPSPDVTERRPTVRIAMGTGDVESARFIYSPNALDDLQALIRSARSSVQVEFMDLPPSWKDEGEDVQNPLVSELIDAAKGGSKVQVLLNTDFNPNKPTNRLTARLLQRLGRCEKLPLTARIVNSVKAGIEIIHNKGMILDGQRALVSSINGTRNSIINNREVALLLESPDAAKYYGRAFAFDWKSSRTLPKEACDRSILGAFFQVGGTIEDLL